MGQNLTFSELKSPGLSFLVPHDSLANGFLVGMVFHGISKYISGPAGGRIQEQEAIARHLQRTKGQQARKERHESLFEVFADG